MPNKTIADLSRTEYLRPGQYIELESTSASRKLDMVRLGEAKVNFAPVEFRSTGSTSGTADVTQQGGGSPMQTGTFLHFGGSTNRERLSAWKILPWGLRGATINSIDVYYYTTHTSTQAADGNFTYKIRQYRTSESILSEPTDTTSSTATLTISSEIFLLGESKTTCSYKVSEAAAPLLSFSIERAETTAQDSIYVAGIKLGLSST